MKCFLEQMPEQCCIERFRNYSSTSYSQLKLPRMHHVSWHVVGESGVSLGSGTGQSPPESFEGSV